MRLPAIKPGIQTMNVLQSSNQKPAEDLEGWYKWIGKKVCISGTKPGILKYFGRTEFADGIWCGVELNEPIGKNNGSVKGVQYFTCKDNHGIFVSVNKVEKVQEKAWDRNLDGQKKQKSRRFTLHSGPSQAKIGSITSDEEFGITQIDKRRRTTFFKFPNDNVSRMSITSNLQKPQLNNSYVISTEDNITEDSDDILNKTVILTEENVMNHDDLNNVSTNKICPENNSVLNSTFDVNYLQANEVANNNKETVLDGTFVLGDPNIECNESSTSDKLNSNDVETDDSLSILSLSQMKDFTICTEQLVNDSNLKLQNVHLSNSCEKNKVALRSENKPVSSSGFFQTDLKLFQENVLEDSVFSQNKTDNGDKGPLRVSKGSLQESFPPHLSDEAKDISFEPARDQSSTPSEGSKQMFSKRMSFIKSFQLDDSFKFETKRYSSSTPNRPVLPPPDQLAGPSELVSKVDIPVLPVEDFLGSINLSLIDDQTLPSTYLDTVRSSEEEPLKNERKSGNFNISDLVLHPVKASDAPPIVHIEISNGRKASCEAPLKFDLQKISGISSHSTDLLTDCSKQPVSVNLNITQEVGSDMKGNSAAESNTAVFKTEAPPQNICDTTWAQECNSVKDEVLSGSILYPDVTKPGATGGLSSTLKNNSGSGDICESVSAFPSSGSYCIQKVSSEGSNLNPHHNVLEKQSASDVLQKTFNCNTSYTVVPLNSSYTLAVNGINKNEDSTANGKMTAVSKVSSEPECSVVIDQLQNEHNFSSENTVCGQNEDHAHDAHQNLNATVCISSNINSHNLTFDVTESSEIQNVGTNRSNVCMNLTRQSVGPVVSKINDRNKIVSNTMTSKSALLTNSNKPCVPSNKDQTVSNKFGDSMKQNNNVQSQKPLNRRYSAAPRIASQENKTQPKNQVASKIDTNLKSSRLSLPRQSVGPPTNTKKQTDSDNAVFKVPDLKAVKNALNYQRLRQDARKENSLDGSQKYPPGKKNVTTPSSSENKSFILKENTKAVNVSVQNTENGLPAPSLSRRSSIQSVSSQSSSKIAAVDKNNTSKSVETKDFNSKNDQKLDASVRRQTVGVPPSSQKLSTSRNQKLNDSANSQKSVASNTKEKQNLTAKKMEGPRVPGRLSESAGIKRGIPRRTCIPKLKPVQQC